MEVQRRTVVVIDNLVKLVRDPNVAAFYLSPLLEGVEKVATGAAFPEVRAFGETALETLMKSGASKSGSSTLQRDVGAEESAALAVLTSKLPEELVSVSTSKPNGPHQPKYNLLKEVLAFQSSIVADLVFARKFEDTVVWKRSLSVYLAAWTSADKADAYTEDVRSHFITLDQEKYGKPVEDTDEEGEVLCNTLFSLAYGALLLLSHTTLRLVRGRRYGILGTNGSGHYCHMMLSSSC